MMKFCLRVLVILGLAVAAGGSSGEAMVVPESLKQPVEEGIWLRPASEGPAEPTIGFKEGIRISLWPTRGPRGLIRIQTPYVFPDGKRTLLNFVAIEPVVKGWRCLSELEHSKMDDTQGKRFWFSDDLSDQPTPVSPWACSRGKTGKVTVGGKSVETLSIVVNCEKLENGAQPCVQVMFRSDRPNEVGFKVYNAKDSAEMQECVLTATMGNFARTRKLWLADKVVETRDLWPDFRGNDFGEPKEFALQRLRVETDGAIIAAITPDENDPASAQMPPGGWVYSGKVATQYWRIYKGSAKPDLRARVNCRATYWGGHVPIPGGPAYENFELIEKYEPGVESWFGVTLKTPEQMGWQLLPLPREREK